MKAKKFTLSRPTGIIAIVLIVLAIVGFGAGIIISIQGVQAFNAGNYGASVDWNIAAMYTFEGASIGLVIGLVSLYLNFRGTKKSKKISCHAVPQNVSTNL